MSITQETRREAYEAIGPKRQIRRQLLLEILGDREMTVDEIEDELIRIGEIRAYNRNFVAPRLTELRKKGILEVIGKRKSPISGVRISVWAKKDRPTAGTVKAEKEYNPDTVYTGEEEIVK